MTFYPKPGVLFIKPLKDEESKTDSGIILKENTEHNTVRIAEVTAAHKESTFSKGDKVVFDAFSARGFRFNQEDHLLLDEGGVLATYA